VLEQKHASASCEGNRITLSKRKPVLNGRFYQRFPPVAVNPQHRIDILSKARLRGQRNTNPADYRIWNVLFIEPRYQRNQGA
jgi:hypothetical protein